MTYEQVLCPNDTLLLNNSYLLQQFSLRTHEITPFANKKNNMKAMLDASGDLALWYTGEEIVVFDFGSNMEMWRETVPGYITGYLRGGCFGRKRRPLKPWQSRNMEAYRFRNHSILCWFSNGRKMVFFTIERPEQMCYNGFENVLEDKEEGVTEA